MKKSRITLLSIVLSLTMVLGLASSAMALDTSYSSIFPIGKDTTYFQVDGTNSSGPQSVHYVEYQPNSSVTPIIAYGNSLYGKSTITYVADFLEKSGKKVIAGINADFFDTTTGIPIGIVINEGVFISSNLGSPAIGFKADGSAIIGTPANAMYLKGENGGTLRVSCFNKGRSKYNVCLYDENYGTSTKTTTQGTNIILERVDGEELVVNGDVKLRVVSITENTTEAAAIGKNQMVLTASADCQTDIVSPFSVGEIVTFSVDAEESDWDDVMYAVGGKVMLDNGAVDVTGSPTGINPRSAVGIKSDGTVVLYEVDGRQSGFSVGMTMNQLANEMLSLGCVDAINLDGGGSSAIIVQRTGEDSYGVVNSPSDGSLRKCANYIMLVNNQTANGKMTNLGIYPEYKYVMKNSSTKLRVKAADASYYGVANPTDVNYSVISSSGSIDGNKFVAADTNGTAVIQAESNGALGKQNIFVVAGISSMTVVKSGNTTAVSSLNPDAETQVSLDISKVSLNGKAVQPDDGAVKWSATIGTIDSQGNYTAPKTAGTGEITVSYGNYVKTIPVTVKSTKLEANTLDTLVADFEKAKEFNISDGALSLNGNYGNYHNGYQALQVDYNMESGTAELSYKGNNSAVGNAKKIYGWFKGDGTGVKVTALFADSRDNRLTAAMSGGLSGKDYLQCVGNIPENAEKFIGFLLTKGSNTKGTIYIDQIVMSGKYSADTVYPSVTITKCPESVSAGSAASVIANISDSNGTVAVAESGIKAYVDGKEIAFTYNAETGNIAFNTANLQQGIHRVTVEATDVFGNITRKSADINVGSAASVFADTTGHWAAPYIGFVADRGIVKGENVGGKNYFNPNRNLTRAEFAVIMARFLDLSGGGSLPYADKASIKSWAADAVEALYKAGIMTGSEMGGKVYFYPNQPITRQEVMTVISKSLQSGYYVENHNFADLASIPAWSLPHINKLVSLGIVGGYADGTILPKNNITRAEIAKIVYGLF